MSLAMKRQTNEGAKLRTACALGLLTLLGACSSGPAPRLMLLGGDVAPGSYTAGTAAGTAQRQLLVVRTVTMPEYLDRRAMLYRSSDAELKRFPDAVWAERPGESVTRLLGEQLAAGLPGWDVRSFTTAGETPPALALNVMLESFEPGPADGGGYALRLRGAWNLSGSIKADGRISADVPMSTLDATSTVAAMRTALKQAAAGIAAQVQQAPQK
jgi:uncharacterized lipoprotein YmbA